MDRYGAQQTACVLPESETSVESSLQGLECLGMDDKSYGSTSGFSRWMEEYVGGRVRADVMGEGRMEWDPCSRVVDRSLIVLIC